MLRRDQITNRQLTDTCRQAWRCSPRICRLILYFSLTFVETSSILNVIHSIGVDYNVFVSDFTMNEVQPIKNLRDIERIKANLNDRNLLLFTFGINTALRISDILSLRVRDVTGGAITVRERKTRKIKRIKINASLSDAINTLVPASANPDDFLFPSRKGNAPISRVQAWRILNSAAERAGVDIAIGTHSLRKTFAYHAYNNGTDITL